MKSYNPNILNEGVHKVKVTLQQWDCFGHITYDMRGNCKGLSVMGFDFETTDGEENDRELSFDEDLEIFSVSLKNENGDVLQVSGTPSDMNDMIVAIEIVDYL